MNPILKARQDELNSLIAQANSLPANATAEDVTALTAQINDKRAAVDAAKTLSSTAADADAYLNTAVPKSVGATPKLTPEAIEAMRASGINEAAIQAVSTMQTGQERVGTELFGRTKDGVWMPEASEGWGISERQFKAISEPKYAKAFGRLLRGTADSHDISAVLTEGNDGQGGFLAPPEFVAEVIMRKPHPTSILGRVRTLPCSRDRVIYPRINYTTDDIYTSGVRMQYVGENGPTGDITDPAFGDVEIPIFTGQFNLEVSRNLIEDAAVPVAPLIAELARQAYELGMDNMIVNGTGVNQPSGILQNPGGTNEPPTVNIGNAVTADGLTDLVYGLPPQYQENAVALMNFIDAFKTFAKIKDAANHYVFGLQSTFDGALGTVRQPVLFGKEVIFSAFMPNGGSAAKVVAYGDLRDAYVFAQRVGLSVLPYGDQDKTMLKANKVGWMFRFRNGGDVVQPRALRVGVQS